MTQGKAINKDRYWLWVLAVSVVVSFLIHTPEIIALTGNLENHNVFPDIRLSEVASEIFFSFVSLITLFALSTWIFKFNKPKKRIGPRVIILSFLFGWLFSALLSNGFYWLYLKFHIPAVHATINHYLHPLRDCIISLTVTCSCYVISLVRRQRQDTAEIHALQMENVRTQYEALKNQLNPHMLFNSLNTLSSLIREEPDKALHYTQELSNVLRYMLQPTGTEEVTLADELEFVEAYTFLLKMRYEDNIGFDMDVDKKYTSHYLPPMSLQLLVENAVKHNEISSQKPLVITVSCNGPEIKVCNPIQSKITASTGPGIGLDNLGKRFRLLYDRDITVEMVSGSFCVTIPLISPAEYESIDRRR